MPVYGIMASLISLPFETLLKKAKEDFLPISQVRENSMGLFHSYRTSPARDTFARHLVLLRRSFGALEGCAFASPRHCVGRFEAVC